MSGAIPEWWLTIVAAATIFTIMFDLGLGIALRQFRWVWQHPGLIARALFCVLVAVPALAVLVARTFELARPVQIGIVLMAISPGAPVALRRSLAAGGHRSFAPALQILLALLAVVSIPLSIALLNEVYAGQASIAPGDVAKQVLVAQLLPLGLGVALRNAWPAFAAQLEPRVARVGTLMLIGFVALAIVDIWQPVVEAGSRIVLAIVTITWLALGAGHLLGGPDETTRTAVAISSAARNAGLALLVATLNAAAPEISATALAYLLISAIAIVPYAVWRRRAAAASRAAES
jgi:bile acid:Na+ symporter, BASS family